MASTREISIRRDGLTLRGRIDCPHALPAPAVILFHGFAGDIGDRPGEIYQRITEMLVEAGQVVVRFDFNGHGKSDGDFTQMDPFNELEDAFGVLDYVRSLEFVTTISILGHSQGGVIGGMLAGYCPDFIHKLCLLAPAATLKTDAQTGRCMAAHYNPARIPDSVNVDGFHVVGGKYFRIAQLLPIYEVTARFDRPVLDVHGIHDRIVDVSASKRYAKELKHCRLVLLEDLDHGLCGADQSRMLEEILTFFREKDAGEE